MTRVDNMLLGKTFTYVYDRGGNILSKSEHAYTVGTPGTATDTVTYTYGDSNWKDKLTAYDGTAITHDDIGNPLDDGIWAYTWQAGRQLISVEKTGETVTFDYDADGLRIRKTSTSRGTTNYTLRGGKIVRQVAGMWSCVSGMTRRETPRWCRIMDSITTMC